MTPTSRDGHSRLLPALLWAHLRCRRSPGAQPIKEAVIRIFAWFNLRLGLPAPLLNLYAAPNCRLPMYVFVGFSVFLCVFQLMMAGPFGTIRYWQSGGHSRGLPRSAPGGPIRFPRKISPRSGGAFCCLLVGISGCVMLFRSRESGLMKRLVLTIAILLGLAAPAWAGFAEGAQPVQP